MKRLLLTWLRRPRTTDDNTVWASFYEDLMAAMFIVFVLALSAGTFD